MNIPQAEAECTVIDEDSAYDDLRNKDCSSMAINGTLAGDTGVYPQIDVQYKWKMCNFNENSSTKLLSAKNKASYFKLWNAQNNFLKILSSDITLAPYEVSGSGPGSGPESESEFESDGNCVSLTRNETIDTEIANWYISTKFEGHPSVDENRVEGNPYCYAYAFNPIRVSYGPCTMSVSTE